MDLVLEVFDELDASELRETSSANFTRRKSIIRGVLKVLRPKKTKNWTECKVVYLAGLLDKLDNLNRLRDVLLTRFEFMVVSEVIDNMSYNAVSQQRYAGYYKSMLPTLTNEMVVKYAKRGLISGMPPTICEYLLTCYRSQGSTVVIAPSIGFYLDGGTSKTLVLGTRWPDRYRNWSHSVLFVADHVERQVFILDSSNERQWSYQTEVVADYFAKEENVIWSVIEKLCPPQMFSGDRNIVTLMLIQSLVQTNLIPEAFSKKEIQEFKSKLVQDLFVSLQ